MENYKLDNNEVVLFRSDVVLLQNKNSTTTKTELLLTNKCFVFINKTKKPLRKEIIETVSTPIESMKIYNEMPYMVIKGKVVEIYTTNGEFLMEFKNWIIAKEFFNKSMRVASGYSKFVRGVKKASKEIKETNDALNIDIVGSTKKALNFTADVIIDYVDKPKKGKVQLISSVAKIFKNRQGKETLQIESKNSSEQIALPTPQNDDDKVNQ